MGECTVWSDLPDDLIERVLCRLPIPTILTLSSTSRTWKDLVFTHNLLNLWTGELFPTPCFLGTNSDCETFTGYNPVSCRWYDLFLAFPIPALRRGVYLTASAGGLLCFAATFQQAVAFFICNPLTRSWKQLPSPGLKLLPRVAFGHHVDLATCMVSDSTRKHYKIIVVGNAASGWIRITQIYFSCTDSWIKLDGAIPRDVDFCSYGLFCNGYVYYMMAGWSNKVMVVNVEEGTWSKLEAPLPRFLVRPRLVEKNGCLLLVGGVHKYWRQDWNCLKPQSIRVWELDQTNLVWVEIGRMPEEIFNKFIATLGDEIQDFKCTGLCHVIFFTSCSPSGFSMVQYDSAANSWNWVPYPEKLPPVNNVVIFQAKLCSTV